MKTRKTYYLISEIALPFQQKDNLAMPSKEDIEENIRSMSEMDNCIMGVYNMHDALIIAKHRSDTLVQSNEEGFLIFEITATPSKLKKDFYIPYNEYCIELDTVIVDFLPGILINLLEDTVVFTKAHASYFDSELVEPIHLNIKAKDILQQGVQLSRQDKDRIVDLLTELDNQSDNKYGIRKFLSTSVGIEQLPRTASLLTGLFFLVGTAIVFELSPEAIVASVCCSSLLAGIGTAICSLILRNKRQRLDAKKIFENYDLTSHQESNSVSNDLEFSSRAILPIYNARKSDDKIPLILDNKPDDENFGLKKLCTKQRI